MFQGDPFPSRDEPIDRATRLFSWRYLRWFTGLRASIDAAQTLVPSGLVQLTGQSATIGTTAIPTAALAAGMYAVSWYAQVTTAAAVTSDFQVTISWTRNGVPQSFAGTLTNGNTTATKEGDKQLVIHIDENTPVSYAVAYNANPAATMLYEFNLCLQIVSRDA